MKNIVIITSDAIRHKYFKIRFSNGEKINVIATYVESDVGEQSISRKEYDAFDDLSCHFIARHNTEHDFFSDVVNSFPDNSKSCYIRKNEINSDKIVEEIQALNPDFVVTFGCSIIKPPLIDALPRKIINVHLGISPYYFGAGTNFHALVNNDFQSVGYTFMYMDEGVDTGEIIHQARARVEPLDNPHIIGNRLIKDMVKDFITLISYFEKVVPRQAVSDVVGPTYRIKDATDDCTKKLYESFANGDVKKYLQNRNSILTDFPIIRQDFIR
ncbi:formyltransferase family protein [Litoricola sp.]|nr:formyltransferase family protein [Litorivicinus sp.]